jgi:hypothetical protein
MSEYARAEELAALEIQRVMRGRSERQQLEGSSASGDAVRVAYAAAQYAWAKLVDIAEHVIHCKAVQATAKIKQLFWMMLMIPTTEEYRLQAWDATKIRRMNKDGRFPKSTRRRSVAKPNRRSSLREDSRRRGKQGKRRNSSVSEERLPGRPKKELSEHIDNHVASVMHIQAFVRGVWGRQIASQREEELLDARIAALLQGNTDDRLVRLLGGQATSTRWLDKTGEHVEHGEAPLLHPFRAATLALKAAVAARFAENSEERVYFQHRAVSNRKRAEKGVTEAKKRWRRGSFSAAAVSHLMPQNERRRVAPAQ